MNKEDLVSKPWEFFKQLGGKNISFKEKHQLSENIVDLWLGGDAHNAMELAQGVAEYLIREDAKSVLKEAAGEIRLQTNYKEELERNAANHCWINALKKVGLKP